MLKASSALDYIALKLVDVERDKEFSMKVAPNTTVSALRRQIEDESGVRLVENLLCFGSVLSDGKVICFNAPKINFDFWLHNF